MRVQRVNLQLHIFFVLGSEICIEKFYIILIESLPYKHASFSSDNLLKWRGGGIIVCTNVNLHHQVRFEIDSGPKVGEGGSALYRKTGLISERLHFISCLMTG